MTQSSFNTDEFVSSVTSSASSSSRRVVAVGRLVADSTSWQSIDLAVVAVACAALGRL
jgi:hypothetical protein